MIKSFRMKKYLIGSKSRSLSLHVHSQSLNCDIAHLIQLKLETECTLIQISFVFCGIIMLLSGYI